MSWLRIAIFLHDLFMVALAWLGAYWLRYNLGPIPLDVLDHAVNYLPWVVLIQAGSFSVFGFYRGLWRFASVPDLIKIASATLSSAAMITAALAIYNRLDGVPRASIPLYIMLLILLLSGPRLLYRFWRDRHLLSGGGQRALIIGAGQAGDSLVRDLLREGGAAYEPIGLLDDNPAKLGGSLHGIPVLGGCNDLAKWAKRRRAEVILIATPSATPTQMRRIVDACEYAQLPFLTLPSVTDLLNAHISRQALRDVAIEDLLGRSPVKLDWQAVETQLRGRRILVSGGGGSIGSELCRQLAQLPIAALTVLEKNEYQLYRIEQTLRWLNPNLALTALLGDVTDAVAVNHALAQQRPDVVFHAAAYKHVPLLEQQAREAIHNNVIGTWRLARAAVTHGVSQFVLISTDKAVRPSNVMGATKRCAELLCQSLNGEGATAFIAVRFGNVLDSAGSVVPLFREQIQRGGPVTVTDPEVTRYFMTIPEASQLILQAAGLGQGGETFVLDMGEPIKIRYLAEQMIRLSGKRPGIDIEIRYTGLRPGEKLHEALFLDEEQRLPTPHEKLRLAQAARWPWPQLRGHLQALEQHCRDFDETAALTELRRVVPEFSMSTD